MLDDTEDCNVHRSSMPFMELEYSLPCSQGPIASPVLSQMNPLHPTSLRYISIISSDVYLGLSAGLYNHSEKGNFVFQ